MNKELVKIIKKAAQEIKDKKASKQKKITDYLKAEAAKVKPRDIIDYKQFLKPWTDYY